VGAADDDGVVLGGSPSSPVVRVGDTVRRPMGPWTPAVHALLRYLEDAGFEGAPQVLGIDEQGREMVTYLPSEPVWQYSEEAVAGGGRLVRRLHGVLAGFVAPADAAWRLADDKGTGLQIGHNDIGPRNAVYAGGVPYGFIDWELAGPRRPLHDLACAAINFTPLRPDVFCRAVGFAEPPDRPHRLALFCDAYGLDGPDGRSQLLDAIEAMERDDLQRLIEFGTAGISPYAHWMARGEARHLQWDLDWFVANRRSLAVALGCRGG